MAGKYGQVHVMNWRGTAINECKSNKERGVTGDVQYIHTCG